jgi:anti-sigma factor RsiW
MNPEALDRLLIDRAVGELPPDTSALLEAYLQTDPDASKQAVQLEKTMRLAKKALTPSPEPALPVPAFNRPLRVVEDKSAPVRLLPQWAYGMAACFISGLAVGWFMIHPPAKPSPRETFVAARVAPLAAAPAESGFWSVSRLSRLNSTAVATTSPQHQLIWTSPVKKPQLAPQL